MSPSFAIELWTNSKLLSNISTSISPLVMIITSEVENMVLFDLGVCVYQ